MDDRTQVELEAAAFRALRDHLRARTDVQNIDLMNLAGFCRNCLSRWYQEAAAARGSRSARRRRGRSSTGCPTTSGWRVTRRRRRRRPGRLSPAGRRKAEPGVRAQSGRRRRVSLAAAGQADRVGVDGGDLHALDAVAGLHPLDVAVRQPHQGVAAVGAGEDPDQRDVAAGEADAMGGGALLHRLRGRDRGYRRHRLGRGLANLLRGRANRDGFRRHRFHPLHRDRLHRHGLRRELLAYRGGGDDGLPRRHRCHDHLALRGGLRDERLHRRALRGGGDGLGADDHAARTSGPGAPQGGGAEARTLRRPRRRRWPRRCSPA